MTSSRGTTESGFEAVAGVCAVVAGAIGFLYSAAFVVVAANVAPQLSLGPSWVLLLVGSVLGSVALVVVYVRVRDVDPAVALLSLVLGAGGALGAALHGAYEVALVLHPPAAAVAELPSQIDPRGALTFGATGFALFGISWLMRRSGRFPSGLAALGYASAVLMVLVYLGRLVVLTPTNPLVLVPAALEGFVVNPIWYIWLGLSLLRGPAAH